MPLDHSFAELIMLSFFITLSIFMVGILLNYGLDFVRVDTILNQMVSHEIGRLSFVVEQEFTQTVSAAPCNLLRERVVELKKQMRQVGADLSGYSSASWLNKKDFDYLKRKYILLQLRFFSLVQGVNTECGNTYIPIVFFYSVDNELSVREGFVLEDLSKAYEDKVIVLSIDKDYIDEPLVGLFAKANNVSRAPTIIIGNVKHEGFAYQGVLNATILSILRTPDPYAPIDFGYVLRSAGTNMTWFKNQTEKLLIHVNDSFAKGDLKLLAGRVFANRTLICNSLADYDAALDALTNMPESAIVLEERALLLETIASVRCGRNNAIALTQAESAWRKLGVQWRADILHALANNQEPTIHFAPLSIAPTSSTGAHNASRVVLGSSRLTLLDGARVLPQTDRVKRDWLGGHLNQSPWGNKVLHVFSEEHTLSEEELRADIGWHEGGRLLNVLNKTRIIPLTATGTMVAYSSGKWYAPDEKGVFRFEVPLDKVSYPTARFLHKNIGLLIDTHGVNMLVEQAIRLNASVVWSDCDHPGKVAAAQYLSEHDITVVCFPDKYAFLGLGHDLKLLPSPPLHFVNNTTIIGGQECVLQRNQVVVVENATPLPYALWYYQTPTNYFEELRTTFPLDIVSVQITDFNQTSTITSTAESIGANTIAVRVYSQDDYVHVRDWLAKNSSRHAVLFHSAPYPYGYLLFQEFANQTCFGDVNPRFE